MLWPHLFLFEYPHLGTIPSWPEDPKDSLSIMWWNPARNKIFPLENGVLDGIGQLSTSKCWIFEDMSKGIKEKVEIYKKKSTPNALVSQLVRAIDNALIHMGSLKSPFGLMRFKDKTIQKPPFHCETLGMLKSLHGNLGFMMDR